jgi:ribose-phosphate pyrophosphokinase
MNLVLIPLPGYEMMAADIGRLSGSRVTPYADVQRFPDGEAYHRLPPIRGDHVVLVGGTIDDAHVLELFDTACAAVMYGAQKLTLLVPYFGYSTMERAVKEGEAVKAKARARLLSAIPRSPLGNEIHLVDLHTEGLVHYFENGTFARHIYANRVICDGIRSHANGAPFVLGSVDAGRAKWVQSLAHDLNVRAAFALKQRISATETKLVALSESQFDPAAIVFIYDDMIRTGGSLIEAAQAYLSAGAKRIVAVATHGVLPGDSLKRIEQSGLIERLIVTDSHPRGRELARTSDFITVVPLAATLAACFIKS